MSKERNTITKSIIFSIFLGVLLTFLVSFAAATAIIMKLDDNGVMLVQAIAYLIMAIFVTFYMTRGQRSLTMYGFKKIDLAKSKDTLYYIPLLIIALIQPILGGINTNKTILEVLLILIFTLLVGYTEETIFRGIIRVKLQVKSSSFYIVFSSIFFGILHMANALNGELIGVIMQVINAFLIGIILALLITVSDNIIPLVLFHFLYDFLAIMTNDVSTEKELFIIIVLNVFYTLYGVFLYIVLKRRSYGKIESNKLINNV
ncbi:MAG: hypothetical protein K0S41_4047 [Anaerocolumna sp.]|jgi:membrane protease YdiL (CAAX protease family)|nr:hypothetical protein [Anaerocolumna sp.]